MPLNRLRHLARFRRFNASFDVASVILPSFTSLSFIFPEFFLTAELCHRVSEGGYRVAECFASFWVCHGRVSPLIASFLRFERVWIGLYVFIIVTECFGIFVVYLFL